MAKVQEQLAENPSQEKLVNALQECSDWALTDEGEWGFPLLQDDSLETLFNEQSLTKADCLRLFAGRPKVELLARISFLRGWMQAPKEFAKALLEEYEPIIFHEFPDTRKASEYPIIAVVNSSEETENAVPLGKQ